MSSGTSSDTSSETWELRLARANNDRDVDRLVFEFYARHALLSFLPFKVFYEFVDAICTYDHMSSNTVKYIFLTLNYSDGHALILYKIFTYGGQLSKQDFDCNIDNSMPHHKACLESDVSRDTISGLMRSIASRNAYEVEETFYISSLIEFL